MSSRLPTLVCAAALAACATTAPPSKLHEAIGHPKMSPDELRIRVRALARRFSGQLEALADEIASHAPDPQTRFEMTRFKINAIPALQSSLFEPDPVAALIDAWVLIAQLEDAIASRNVLRDDRVVASQRVAAMEQEIETLWGALAGPDRVARAHSRVHDWAKAHPVTTTVAAREPTAPLFANLTASSGVSPMSAIGSALSQMQDLQAWLNLQAAYLPKQARWQAEYLMQRTANDPALAIAASQVGDYLSGERRATMGALDHQRQGLQAFLAGERKAALDDVGQMGYSWIDHAFDRATALADRLFLRFLLLLALLIGGALVALQIVFSGRRRRELLRRS